MQAINALLNAAQSALLPRTATPVVAESAPIPDFTKRPVRRLSKKLLEAYPFMGEAIKRINHEVTHRTARWLRRLDTINVSGYRTKQQRWDALRDIIEFLFVRLDLATLQCGWMDENGEFHVNRQKGLAEDSGLHVSRVSRTLRDLEKAKYLRRETTTRQVGPEAWISTTRIHVTHRFFNDLGLSYQFTRAHEGAQKRRARKLHEIEARKSQRATQKRLTSESRQNSIRRSQTQKRQVEQLELDTQRFEYKKQRANFLHQLMQDYPDALQAELIAVLNQKYPPLPS